jgi:outer membrane protein assembly factor BamA
LPFKCNLQRYIADPTRLASKAVRQQLGHSLKSAVSYTASGDARDHAVRPTRGHLWRGSARSRIQLTHSP